MFNNQSSLFKKLSLFVLCTSIATGSNATPHFAPAWYDRSASFLAGISTGVWFSYVQTSNQIAKLPGYNNAIKNIEEKVAVHATFSDQEKSDVGAKTGRSTNSALLTGKIIDYCHQLTQYERSKGTSSEQSNLSTLNSTEKIISDICRAMHKENEKKASTLHAYKKRYLIAGTLTALCALTCGYLGLSKK